MSTPEQPAAPEQSSATATDAHQRIASGYDTQAPHVTLGSVVIGDVCDPTALGTLYLSPFTLAAFEEEAGSTNSSTVRAEANGLFIVQRLDAAATFFAAPS